MQLRELKGRELIVPLGRAAAWAVVARAQQPAILLGRCGLGPRDGMAQFQRGWLNLSDRAVADFRSANCLSIPYFTDVKSLL